MEETNAKAPLPSRWVCLVITVRLEYRCDQGSDEVWTHICVTHLRLVFVLFSCPYLSCLSLSVDHQAQGRPTCGCHREFWARWWSEATRATWCAGTTPTAPGLSSLVRWRCCSMSFQLQVHNTIAMYLQRKVGEDLYYGLCQQITWKSPMKNQQCISH